MKSVLRSEALNQKLAQWVEESAALMKPDRIFWCDGSETEYKSLVSTMLDGGDLVPLNQDEYPNCYLHRSNPNDVARVEKCTFICTTNEIDAGPTNNWMAPEAAKAKVRPLFEGCMQGRTMYVVPYVMGPVGSPISKVGVEITDSPYVVASMRIMTRMGQTALDQLGEDGDFVPGLHSTGDCNPDRRYILHFPEERLIWSYGSGYGGNALLGKKCLALRIASTMAKDEGWMAEHMLILELEDPTGELTYFAAAFPSACGKTNLAMLISPLEDQGYKVRTVGDDIAWMEIGEDGRLWAINPEAGFFGVVPGTSVHTNPNALIASHSNSIYTNVALCDDGIPWWEGKDEEHGVLTDWLGNHPWDGSAPAAHPNSRFTAPATQCPSISPHWEDKCGVPISGIIFGGRRNKTVPLVSEAFNWEHGTYLGATMASRTTAAAEGKSDVLRFDPMAMLPFCGYNMGDYFGHWLNMGQRISQPPKLFFVNWFRTGDDGKYLWPGYGENVRILIWMLARMRGQVEAQRTAVGFVPTAETLHMEGLDLPNEILEELLKVDPAEWIAELPEVEQHLNHIGDRLPAEIRQQFEAVKVRLHA